MAKAKRPLPSGAPWVPPIREELQCPICYELFLQAVTLRCGHNFCRGCVSHAWQAQAHPACPVCKVPCKAYDLRTNHTLANIVEIVLQQERQQQAALARERPDLCSLHGQEAKFFCLDDKQPVCALCQSDERHAAHRMKPVAEVVETYRAKCKVMENSLRDKMKQFEKVQSDYRLIASHNETESAQLEKKIRKQFEELHEFLQNEERAILGQLQEERQKKQGLIQDKIKTLSDESHILLQEIGQLQADMEEEEDISFLKKHKSRKRRIAWTIEQPEAIPQGMLVEVTKYLDCLQYKAWKKMVDIIKVVPFSFDPNTGSNWLDVSDDLTSIAPSTYKLMLDVPERFSTRMPCVLGSKGYSKGFHSWEVDISGVQYWHIGVARKPCGHFWSFGLDHFLGFTFMLNVQEVKSKKTPPPQSIQSDKMPGNSPRGLKRVLVELDCDRGQLSFYDAETHSHMFSFHDLFGEVFPYFSVTSIDNMLLPVRNPLRICPLSVQIAEGYPKLKKP